jgi:hypothetical protein
MFTVTHSNGDLPQEVIPTFKSIPPVNWWYAAATSGGSEDDITRIWEAMAYLGAVSIDQELPLPP